METDNKEAKDEINLGGNITLSGFKELDKTTMVVVKKIVGSRTKKITDSYENFENITVKLKQMHGDKKTEKGLFEIHIRVVLGGKQTVSEATGRNLFFILAEAFSKLEKQLQK